MDYSYLLIGSEIALSLYPQLIKLVSVDIDIQVVVRFITYSTLALVSLFTFSSNSIKEIKNIPWINSIIMGCVNILHVVSSYYSFSVLSSGFSYSLFYTYPIFNLLGRSICNNEKILPINYLYILLAICGVYLVYYKQSYDTQSNDTQSNNSNNIKGIFAGICSAITESLIFFMVKNDISTVSPFIQIIKTYLLGGVLSFIYLSKKWISNYYNTNTTNTTILENMENKDNKENKENKENNSLSWNDWITLILFNALIGYIGYVIRFYLIPKLNTLKFNSLIFIGVIFAYIWGYLLSNENIYLENILGSGLILFAIFMMNK